MTLYGTFPTRSLKYLFVQAAYLGTSTLLRLLPWAALAWKLPPVVPDVTVAWAQ